MEWLNVDVQTVLVGLLVILLMFRFMERFKYNLPPGPFALPIIGNFQLLLTKDFQRKWREYKQKYGPVFTIQLGSQRIIMLNDKDVVLEALVKRGGDFANRSKQPTHIILSQGGKNIGFGDYTPLWKIQKRKAGQALRTYMNGDLYERTIHHLLRLVLDKMASQNGGFNPEPFLDWLIFNDLHSVCFSECKDIDDPIVQRFMELEKAIDSELGVGFIEDKYPVLLKVWETRRMKKFKQVVEDFTNLVRDSWNNHHATFDADNIRDLADALILVNKQDMDDEQKDDVSKLTDIHMFQALIDIMRAGSDTSRMILYYALRYMASNQDVQTKCQEEIDRVVGNDVLPGINDRQNLQYCQATLREVMRLGTFIPLGIPHATACDTTVGGYDIPMNTTVLINHWELHHDPHVWGDPDKFDPTRYLDDTGNLQRKPENWLAFSAGPRVCSGETVAKQGLLIMFAAILQRFRIKLTPNTSQKVELNETFWLMVPKDYRIMVTERNA